MSAKAKVKYQGKMDEECIALCDAINRHSRLAHHRKLLRAWGENVQDMVYGKRPGMDAPISLLDR